jgi:putative ABC transport system substrate-binding protein
MRRRDFISLIGSAVSAWPVMARAQQPERVRRIAVLLGWSETPIFRSSIDAFVQGLAQLGWVEGRSVEIDIRWAHGDVDRTRALAKELVEWQPDAIFTSTTPVTAALQRETKTTPIVFVIVADPIGSGFVAGLPKPGGNITGFTNVEASLGGKWLEILKDYAPSVKRVAFMFNPDTAPGGGLAFLGQFEAAARSLAVEPITARVRSDSEIEAVITSLGREQTGLVIMTDSFLAVHQRTIISAAASNNVPVIGADLPSFVRDGGLLSYGANFPDIFGRAASYVDRILHGANAGDLPVQAPTKYDLAVNLRTAKALGLTVPSALLYRAEEVIDQ